MTDGSDYHAKLEHAVGTVANWLAKLIDPDQVVELRALRVQDGTKDGDSTWAGCFRGSELNVLARSALELSGHCSGVYYTLNPLRPERFVNQAPRVQKASHGQLAHDRDVIERRWLLVDIDPVKPTAHKDDSATAAEKTKTLEVAIAVREYLAGEGWARPVLCDSGNGHHLLYKLTEPYTVEAPKLPLSEDDVLRRVLLHLADKFNGTTGTIDAKVYNPARIVKFPGTLACKGVASEERPHRRARVLEVPES
jgi:hypothetical protein